MVKPVATVNVVPKLPKALARLEELAYNMRFAWDQETIAVFRRLDPDVWEQTYHNPVKTLGLVSQERLKAVQADAAFMANYERVLAAYDDYMNPSTTWYQEQYGDLKQPPTIAYFSMEFGITECFQNYSGGLGILSGDHLKSASDLNIPLVGVGLLYQEGYFQQYLNADGWQKESYPINDFFNLPLRLERDKHGEPLKVSVDLPGRKLWAQIWRAQVGRVRLYLLDSNIADNALEEDRSLTDRLYGGDRRTRIRQEILMGIGGIRALDLLGHRPDVCHMNEGHSVFLSLERTKQLMQEKGLSFNQARELIAASTVFTVHTPVPAGLERFGFDLIDEHFTNYMRELGLSREEFIDLGRENMGDYELFSMSVMALKFSYGANGVAQLHGEVSREMWQWMFPGVPTDEVPITAITNGIHVQTWTSREMGTLFDRYLDPKWRNAPATEGIWDAIDGIPDAELWRTHSRRRERLVAFCRTKLKEQLIKRGAPQSEIDAADEILNPEALTFGFARRFATYKRATMIFSDLERLDRIVNNPDRPVQFIFAGKAHPHDMGGKELIRRIVEVARMPEFRHSIVFLENYDMNVARYMIQGSDVWLNNPRRPKEASGTSGMKVIYNGGLNLSILDGWWAEGYNANLGWAIGAGEEYGEDDWEDQDRVEALAIYNIIENDIVPKFYNQGRDGLPRDWMGMVKNSIRAMAPFFTTSRMVQQYTDQFYLLNYKRTQEMLANNMSSGLEYTQWRQNLENIWHHVNVVTVDIDDKSANVGAKAKVTATVRLGELTPDHVKVQLYVGSLDTRGEIVQGDAQDMDVISDNGNGEYTFQTTFKYVRSGDHGLSVRVVPEHKYMHTNFHPHLITWA
ncbi:MAG: alpha-glucan family phosphorylase [Phototrophicaceae bacterium]